MKATESFMRGFAHEMIIAEAALKWGAGWGAGGGSGFETFSRAGGRSNKVRSRLKT